MMRFVLPAIALSLGLHAGLLAYVGTPDGVEQGAEGSVSSTVIVFDTPPAPAASASSEGEQAADQAPAGQAEPEFEPVAEPEFVVEPVVEPEPVAEAEHVAEPVLTVPVPRAKPDVPAELVQKVESRKVEAKPKTKAKAALRKKAVKKRAGTDKKKTGNRVGSAGRSGGASAGEKAAYARRVLAHIQRHKRHPAGGKSGKVRLAVRISPSGSLGGVSVRHSSGNSALDRAAVTTARRASPYPKPPGGAGFSFTVSLRYTR